MVVFNFIFIYLIKLNRVCCFIDSILFEKHFKSKESFNIVQIDKGSGNLSGYKLAAYVKDGYKYLGNLQQLEEACIKELTDKLDEVIALEEWEGETKVETGTTN